MEYRGQEIPDVAYVTRHEDYRDFDFNYIELYLHDLQDMKDAYVKKGEELNNSGVNYKNLRLSFEACGDEYNPNGQDTYAYTLIQFCWDEEETTEEKEKRIEKEKERIDYQINEKARMDIAKKAVEKFELEKAIKTIQNAGGKVMF